MTTTAVTGAPALTLVIPAYNESSNVSAVVSSAVAALDSASWIGSFEIIVVDDGSTDDTADHANECCRRNPMVRLIRHPVNQGLGAALITGYSAARGDRLTYIPGDGEIAVDQAIGLVRDMQSADLIVSRRLRAVSSGRTLATFVLHTLLKLALGFDPGTVSGIYVIRRDVLRSMPLRSKTGLVNLEIPMRCMRAGLQIRSGIVRVSPRISGTSKVTNLRTVVRTFWEVFKLRLALRKEQASR